MTTPTLVQHAFQTGAAPSVTVPLSAQVKGNANVVLFAYTWGSSDPGINSLVDSAGNTYTPGSFNSTQVSLISLDGFTVGVAYCLSIKGGANEVVFNVHLGASAVNVFVHEWGSNFAWAIDSTNSASGGITPSTAPAIGVDAQKAGEVFDCVEYTGTGITLWSSNTGDTVNPISGSGDAEFIPVSGSYPQEVFASPTLSPAAVWSMAGITLIPGAVIPTFFSLNS